MKNILTKKLILIILIPTSLIFSSTSYAGWTLAAESVSGTQFYLDFDRMRKYSGNVYIWELHDYLLPDSDGTLSEKLYMEVDCKKFKKRIISSTFHDSPMGEGSPQDFETSNLNEWQYPSPESVREILIDAACSQ